MHQAERSFRARLGARGDALSRVGSEVVAVEGGAQGAVARMVSGRIGNT